MDLYEYQARQLFKAHGVPVLGGEVASTAQQAREIAQELFANGSQLVVVKAQVKTGGRGKAGGVKLARSAQEATASSAGRGRGLHERRRHVSARCWWETA